MDMDRPVSVKLTDQFTGKAFGASSLLRLLGSHIENGLSLVVELEDLGRTGLDAGLG